MVGDAQAEEPVVEGARSQELQGFEKRAQGCQPSQGETSNMKLIIYIDLRSFFFEHICSFVFVNMTCYKWSQFAAGGQRGWSFPGVDDRDGSLCCDGCSRVFLGFKKRVGKPKRTIQTPNTAKTHTSPNCQFPSKIKRSSPD